MRTIEYTKQFKKDFKREKKSGKYKTEIEKLLKDIITYLIADKDLPKRNRDHALTGNWKDHRDCHIKPDLILIYRKIEDILQLVRIGSHSQLSL